MCSSSEWPTISSRDAESLIGILSLLVDVSEAEKLVIRQSTVVSFGKVTWLVYRAAGGIGLGPFVEIAELSTSERSLSLERDQLFVFHNAGQSFAKRYYYDPPFHPWMRLEHAGAIYFAKDGPIIQSIESDQRGCDIPLEMFTENLLTKEEALRKKVYLCRREFCTGERIDRLCSTYGAQFVIDVLGSRLCNVSLDTLKAEENANQKSTGRNNDQAVPIRTATTGRGSGNHRHDQATRRFR